MNESSNNVKKMECTTVDAIVAAFTTEEREERGGIVYELAFEDWCRPRPNIAEYDESMQGLLMLPEAMAEEFLNMCEEWNDAIGNGDEEVWDVITDEIAQEWIARLIPFISLPELYKKNKQDWLHAFTVCG